MLVGSISPTMGEYAILIILPSGPIIKWQIIKKKYQCQLRAWVVQPANTISLLSCNQIAPPQISLPNHRPPLHNTTEFDAMAVVNSVTHIIQLVNEDGTYFYGIIDFKLLHNQQLRWLHASRFGATRSMEKRLTNMMTPWTTLKSCNHAPLGYCSSFQHLPWSSRSRALCGDMVSFTWGLRWSIGLWRLTVR